MGLSIAISGGITASVLVIILGIIFAISYQINTESLANTDAFEINNSLKKSKMNIKTIQAQSGNDLLNFTLSNNGTVKFWNYEDFDVFITYDADIGGTKTKTVEQFVFDRASSFLGDGSPPPDFKVQRDCVSIASGTSITLTPPSDYTAPTGDAFVRIVDTRLTGNGDDDGGNQNNDDFSVYISDASDLTSQIVFTRIGSASNTLICYEIIEYIGSLGDDNEFVVLDQNTVTYASSLFTVTSPVTPIAATDDSDVVVFITGQGSDSNNRRDWSESVSTAAWNGGADTATFTRGEASGSLDANDLSYAVVEFIGSNWNIERVENVYVAAGVPETQPITDVGSLSRAFLHTQHRSHPNDNGDEQGEEAWISATDTVSFQLNAGATASGTAATVAWVISNTQITGNVMNVQHISGTRPSGGAEQDVWTETIPTPTDSMSSTSIMGENARTDNGNRNYPRGAIALRLTADNTVTLTRSDTGSTDTYRFSVVEFPGTGGGQGSNCNTNAFFDTNDWIVGSITNDLLDPKIVNTHEVGQICTKLSYPIFANGDVQITIITDLGHVASKSVIVT